LEPYYDLNERIKAVSDASGSIGDELLLMLRTATREASLWDGYWRHLWSPIVNLTCLKTTSNIRY